MVLPAVASTLHVGAKRIHRTIQSGINAAKDGDTVAVDPGHYRERNLTVNKRIVLYGIGYPVLDGQNKYEIISVFTGGVTIAGFKLTHSGRSSLEDLSGIKVYNSNGVTIKNNILEDTFFGIYIQNGSKCIIINNRLKGTAVEEQQSGNGIHCWKSDNLTISGNTVSGHRDGIYFEFVQHAQIRKNVVSKNLRYGLHFMFSNDDTYAQNVFQNNGSGVSVMYSKRIKMISNRFEENWGDAAYGILLKEISDGTMEGNYFTKNTSAIYMEGANRITMKRNTFKDNGWALKIQASCMDVVLERNNFIGNTFDVGTNGSLVLNTFKNNYWDKYEGYDLNKDMIGDIPFRPVSMYSMIVEKFPAAMILFRTFITTLLDKTEKILPSLTPENLKDNEPLMRKAF
ncbi:nitrous oxidase accessory protein [Daejeonella lutea]|uniref:Nitrous oxidase accessory protein n=2 Tax=Daejeonella lutea TaxID=572036 RepID=A0A1T5A5E6_9SPHI|nr:nitrous oxidase accessory protein [Daejeonella lutea]